MAKIGDQVTYALDPRTAPTQDQVDGLPAPVFPPFEWSVEGPAYILGTVAPDGMSAILNAIDPGTGVVKVSAFSKGGVQLFDQLDLEPVDAPPPIDDEAVKLGLFRVA
jgi:hypothetical protein